MMNVAEQIAMRFTRIPGVDYTDVSNSTRFILVSQRGVIWNEGEVWGDIAYGYVNAIVITLNSPVHRLPDEYVVERIQWIKEKAREPHTGYYIFFGRQSGAPYDSLKISLYGEDASDSEILKYLFELAEHLYKLAARS